ncbi:AraC family transcriptional regulator [Paenibacillus oenotherae]|uniref:AraC family transcriptional regulator n=1 Tax=Paenibacillus oenotherae TaxID=1435645 RepID=A0ABS7DC47_9BACL|nr:AraC family transcriptional regulator [Paenibacillus oenotherae]MBW7477339.1 AraC family transcriptional regulator [Paenibacillus oenotherae]
MKLNDHILLWNHVFIKVIDIRHNVMEKGEELRSYRLPVSTFLYTVRGNARIWLDDNIHTAKRFHILHGGKGTSLNIIADDELEYYMILYKPTLPLLCRQEIVQLMEKDNPFHYQYAFAPSYPLSLYDYIVQMDKYWHESATLSKLQVKATLYQFVYELLRQLHRQDFEPVRPDPVRLAVRYIREHFNEPLTLDSIAQALDCSAGHLSRLFKSSMNNSPIHYLGQIRIDRTMQLLIRTDATLQEIAEQVGFADAHSLSRAFKKYQGLSPSRFREKQRRSWQDRDLPLSMQRFAVLQHKFYPYNDIENHSHYRTGRELLMQRRTKIAVMTLVMCFSLLVGACSSPANTNVGTQAPANHAAEANINTGKGDQQANAAAKTRIVSTLKGDVEVPAEPKRVASDQYMGHLLKLGIIPVGVRSFMLGESWISKAGISQEILNGIEDLGGFPMNLEKLTYLEPDLIIGSLDKNIEEYQKIGTTVFLPYWEGESTAGPLEKFRRISEIFGKQQEAEQWITEYEKKVAEAKAKIAGIVKEGETVSVVQIGSKAMYVFAAEGGNYGSSTIYQMLQLPPTKQALNMKEGFENISLEVLPEYMGDHVFVYGAKDEGADQIINSDLWKSIPAVQKGQVYMYGSFGEKGDEFVMEDPYSLELQLDTIVNLLLANKK